MMYFGVVEERCLDQFKSGRCRVRIFGLHTENKVDLPTNDLPWAYPQMPINSASVSGIGASATGPVEGTVVSIMFADEHQQIPIMLGTFAGIPTSDLTIKATATEKSIGLVDSDNTPVVDSSGKPVTTSRIPGAMDISANGIAALQNLEKLSSLTKGKNVSSNGTGISDSTPIYSYPDNGNYAIGWGNQFLADNSRVTAATVLTKKQCDDLLAIKLKEFVAGVNRNLKVFVTQSMFDALVSLAYNMGVAGLTGSEMFSALNSEKYDAATALIPSTRASGNTSRRLAEKALFDAEGYPNSDGTVTKTPSQIVSESKPVGTITTTNANTLGFKDPNGVYPLYTGEPDTNKLARNESINSTIVKKKEMARLTGVKTASGKTWSQPVIPYNAKYPYNHVHASESGHVHEVDDTDGSERLHWYHKAGTFEEVDVNGTLVRRIVGDAFEIIERNGNVLIKGSCNLTVYGDANIRVENNANLQILGDFSTAVSGNYSLSVKGNILMKAGGNWQINSAGLSSIDASNKIYLNSGKTFTLNVPSEAKGAIPTFQPLFTPTRKNVYDASYETPEEGDNATYLKKNVNELDPDNATTDTTKVASTPVVQKPVTPVSKTQTIACENLTDDDITQDYQLSKLFTLGDVIKGSSASPYGVPKGVNFGLSASEIVCNLKKLSINCLDAIKVAYPNMIITNTWRSEAVNTRIGGAKNSDHLTGCAADIVFSGFTRKQHYEVAIALSSLLPAWKQLILEYRGSTTWIHVSFKEGSNTNQILTMDAAKNTTLSRGSFTLIN